MNLGRDLARLLLGLLLVVFAAGAIAGNCAGPSRGDVTALQERADSLQRRAESVTAFARMDSLAAVRAEARADHWQHVADSVARVTATVRARVIVRDRIVVDSAGVVHGDTLVADALAAMDARAAADSVAIVGHLVARDSLTRLVASTREERDLARAQLTTAQALRVAVEQVNKRPRFGFASGAVVGVVATAALVHLARP